MASVVLWFVALSGMVTATAPAVRAQVDAGTDSLGTARVLSRGLDSPSGMALDGDMLLVSNAEGGFANNGFVTELDASTGKVIRVISGSGYRFNSPSSLATAGGAVYVTSPGSSASASGSVTVLNASSGALVRVVAGASYRFEGPRRWL